MIILSKWIAHKKGMVKLLPLPWLLLQHQHALGVSVSRGAPVGVSCMWKHVCHQLLVLPANFPMYLMVAKVLPMHLEE